MADCILAAEVLGYKH